MRFFWWLLVITMPLLGVGWGMMARDAFAHGGFGQGCIVTALGILVFSCLTACLFDLLDNDDV